MVGSKLLLGSAAVLIAAAPIGASYAGAFASDAASKAFVLRDGNVLPFTSSMTLFSGDRVFTRAGGHARVVTEGCTKTLSPNSVYTISAACGTSNDFVSQPNGGVQDDGQAKPGVASGGGISTSTLIIAGFAVAALAVGTYAAANSGGEPESPG
jgi:hypothetical protein